MCFHIILRVHPLSFFFQKQVKISKICRVDFLLTAQGHGGRRGQEADPIMATVRIHSKFTVGWLSRITGNYRVFRTNSAPTSPTKRS